MTLSDSQKAEILLQLGKVQQDLAAKPLQVGVVPIKIQCTWSSCKNGRHSLDHYHRPAAGKVVQPAGCCQDCGERIVFLPPPGQPMTLGDDSFVAVFGELQKELIRAHYWTAEFDLHAYNQAQRMGRRKLHENADKSIRTALLTDDPWWRQRAKYNGSVIAYAQHATATCCRQCAAYWHGLPRDFAVPPSEAELAFLVRLAHAYLELRFPDLADEPSKVTPISRGAGPSHSEVERLDDLVIDRLSHQEDPAGLVLAKTSGLQLASAHGSSGGWIEPTQIPLSHAGAA
jgi:hypothetical protein